METLSPVDAPNPAETPNPPDADDSAASPNIASRASTTSFFFIFIMLILQVLILFLKKLKLQPARLLSSGTSTAIARLLGISNLYARKTLQINQRIT
jgi:hypothetical protein